MRRFFVFTDHGQFTNAMQVSNHVRISVEKKDGRLEHRWQLDASMAQAVLITLTNQAANPRRIRIPTTQRMLPCALPIDLCSLLGQGRLHCLTIGRRLLSDLRSAFGTNKRV
jgi:hypothetical protein